MNDSLERAKTAQPSGITRTGDGVVHRRNENPVRLTHSDLGRFWMFQWKARLAAVTTLTAVVASLGGFFDWLHWGW